MKKFLITILIIGIYTLAQPIFGQESFFQDKQNSTNNDLVSGEITTGSRYMLNPNTLKGIDLNSEENFKEFLNSISLYPYIETKIDFKYSGDNIQAGIIFHNNITGYLGETTDTDTTQVTMDITPELAEAYIHYFASPIDILAGYTKVVWGKGDGIHVVDNLNGNDYRDFINGDYLDRRVSENMIKIGVIIGETGYLELVYEPTFTPDKYPESGIWLPERAKQLITLGNQGIQIQLPDTSTMLYSQIAGRYTFSIYGIDLGFSDYFGFVREPVVDTSTLMTGGNISISYDRVNTLGIEASTVVLGFNTWLEAAYNITKDYEGDDPLIHNNSVAYLVGFDREIPIHNLYINIQLIGSYTMAEDKIEAGDIEYNSEEGYTSNTLAWRVSDSFVNDTIKIAFDGAYNIEDKDFMLRPKIQIMAMDDLNFAITYTHFYGDDDTNFGEFKDNNFVELSAMYNF